MIATPHSVWAEVYDLAYEESFGQRYTRLTEETVEMIAMKVGAPAKIVDFGAGTGRLSIPLAQRGYEVTAVDPCREMLQQLIPKPGGGKMRTVEAKMEDFAGDGSYDVALCLFTVMLYLLDEDALVKSARAAHDSLKPGGRLFIDIPSRSIFCSYERNGPTVERTVSVTPQGGDLYLYCEDISVRPRGGEASTYHDSFQIRYWLPEYVMRVLAETGFVVEEDLTALFSAAGSSYYVMRKIGPGQCKPSGSL